MAPDVLIGCITGWMILTEITPVSLAGVSEVNVISREKTQQDDLNRYSVGPSLGSVWTLQIHKADSLQVLQI